MCVRVTVYVCPVLPCVSGEVQLYIIKVFEVLKMRCSEQKSSSSDKATTGMSCL